MELWIRSQDKEVLTRVVDIWKDADKNEIWSKSSFATKNCLGIYKTKERTIEILDEIQKLLIPKTIMETYNVDEAEMLDGTIFIKPMLGDIKIEGCMSYIYEMPKE